MDLPIIPDIVLEAHQKGFAINKNTPAETQFWLFAKQLELEKLTEKFIADKCLIDYSVYADVLFPDQRVKDLLSEMIRRNANYTHMFYLPIEFAIEDDGLRSTDPTFQKNIDDRYRQVLDDWGFKYEIVGGDIETRLKKILNIIKDN